jgi:hypothetical protein
VAKNPSILRNHVRILKNKVTGGGYREYDIYLRAGAGIDDWISVRALAHHYGMLKFLGTKQGYRIGTEDRVLATFPNKAAAKKALVLDQDMAILGPLRELVVEAIQKDEGGFRFVPSVADRIMAGEDDLAVSLSEGGDDSLLEEIPEQS